MHFPAEPVEFAGAAPSDRAYDTDGDGTADFFLYANADGRYDRIGYDHTGDGAADEIIDLDALPAKQCRHVLIVVDGFAYDAVRRHFEDGGLRLFHRPSRAIAPYPVMTDMCMEDMLGYIPCPAFEAKYYDREAGRIVGGSMAYLQGRNEPYNELLDYRAGLLMVPFLYIYPQAVFGKELNDCKKAFDREGQRPEFLTYFSSTAGMSTALGEAGQHESLRGLERLMLQILAETRGLVKFTLASDHGHQYEPLTRIDFETVLEAKGWRRTDRLGRPRDFALIEFGLTTYASFSTNERVQLAGDLVSIYGVELASYAEGEAVVVLAPGGERAVIRQRDNRYAYEPTAGDPLGLGAILAKLTPDADSFYDADELLAATVEHDWPAPLQRLWRAHFALVEHVPDVIVSLRGDRCVGTKWYLSFVRGESTHGSLARLSSTAFVMSTAGPLPRFMRSSDVPRHMAELLDVPVWPLRK